MSRRPVDALQTGPTGLPVPSNLPLDQLNQIQKRLQSLVTSTSQLQAEIAQVPNFDWQVLLTRYATLFSQIYSLSSALTSPASAYIPAQQEALSKYLQDEAKNNNYFMQDEDEQPHDHQANVLSSIPKVNYTDEKNTLLRLSATPFHTMQGDRAARLGEALRTKLDPDVEATLRDSQLSTQQARGEQEDDDSAALANALHTTARHDELSLRALRTWYHVRWRPDELGQTYDFRMRLGDDDEGFLDDDDEAPEANQDAGQGNDNLADDNAGTIDAGNEEEYEAFGDDEEVDEEMEDIA